MEGFLFSESDSSKDQQASAAYLLKMLEQEKASQNLAKAQLESLLTKKKELEALSKKLAFLKSLQEQSLEQKLRSAATAEGDVVSDTLTSQTTTEYHGGEPTIKTVTTATHSDANGSVSKTLETEISGDSNNLNIIEEEHVDFVISTEGAARAAEASELTLEEREVAKESLNLDSEEPESDAAAFQSKLLRLVQQEQELARLESQLASLQELKSKMKTKQENLEQSQRLDAGDQQELEDALKMVELELSKSNMDQDEDEEQDEEDLEALLNRLAQASVKPTFTEDLFKAVPQVPSSEQEEEEQEEVEADPSPENQPEEMNPDQREEVIRLLEEDAAMGETADRIREGMTQILAQMQELVEAQEATESIEEKQFISALFSKLAAQLEELKAAHSKLQKLQELLRIQKEESSRLRLQELLGTTGLQDQESAEAIPATSADSSLEDEDDVDEVEVVQNTETVPISTKQVEVELDEDLANQSEQLSLEDPKMKSLFESRKDEIYKGAATLISSYESDPYFLLALFRKLPKLKSSYARQRLMFAVDEILDDVSYFEQSEEIATAPVSVDPLLSHQCCDHQH